MYMFSFSVVFVVIVYICFQCRTAYLLSISASCLLYTFTLDVALVVYAYFR